MRKILVILMVFAIIIGMSGISAAENKNDGKDGNPNDGNAGKGNDDKDKHNNDDNSDDDSDNSDDSDDGSDNGNNGNSNSGDSKSLKFPSGAFTFGTSDCDRVRILLQIDIDERIRAYKLYNIYWGQQRLDTLEEMIDYCERPPQNFDMDKPITDGYYVGWI